MFFCVCVSKFDTASVGGKDGSEAAACVCGVCRVQQSAAAAGHQLC